MVSSLSGYNCNIRVERGQQGSVFFRLEVYKNKSSLKRSTRSKQTFFTGNPSFYWGDEIVKSLYDCRNMSVTTHPFTVSYFGNFNYYGFTIDGNHRFLLGSGDIVRNTGKTTVIDSILYNKSAIIPVGQVHSGSETINHNYEKRFPKLFIYDEFTESAIKNLQKRQVISKRFLGNPWSLLLIDDCADDRGLLKKPIIKTIAKNGRHWKQLLLLSIQHPTDVLPEVGNSLDGVFIMRETNRNSRESIWKRYAGVIPDFGLFCQLMDQLTTDYCCMYIKNSGTSNDWRDCVFYYKAKPPPADFKFGCKDYWKYANERYDSEYEPPLFDGSL
jgi:hypothetical protein